MHGLLALLYLLVLLRKIGASGFFHLFLVIVSFPSNMPAFGSHLCDPSHPTAVWTAGTRTWSMGDDGCCKR